MIRRLYSGLACLVFCAVFFQAWAHSSTVPADKYLYVVKGKA